MSAHLATDGRRRWLPLLAICLGTFMLLLDVTIVNVALPDIARDLKSSFTDLQWVIDGYALVLAALLLAVGAAADALGRRRTYLGGLALFALASVACGVAPSPGALIGARALQGVGGAAMFATTLALLGDAYEGRDRATAFATWGAVTGLAAAAGPLLGGVLTELASWRWIFVVNVPISVVALVLTPLVVPDVRHAAARRVDLPGALTFTLAAAGLTYGLVESSEAGWGSAQVLAAFAVALVGLAAFVATERRVDAPLLDLGLLRERAFVGTLTAAAVLSAAAFASLAFSSLWLQQDRGLSAIMAGLSLAPLPVAALVVAARGSELLHSGSPRTILPAGLAIIGLGTLVQAIIGADATTWLLAPGLVVVGIGAGLVAPSVASAAVASVPPARAGMAAGAVNTARQLGLAVGIAVLAAVFDGQGGSAAATATDALRTTFLVAGGIGLAGALGVRLLMALAREPAAVGAEAEREPVAA